MDADLARTVVDQTKFRRLVGSLLYLTTSRPDIMFVVCLCARFQSNPKESQLKVAKRILKYLKGTTRVGLWYPFSYSIYEDKYEEIWWFLCCILLLYSMMLYSVLLCCYNSDIHIELHLTLHWFTHYFTGFSA